VELVLSFRVTVAALLSLALAQALNLPLPLWAVLTAVVVTQMSVGLSLQATFDYLAGTLGGAVYGGAVALLFPHANEVTLLAVLALALAPLALIATIVPSLKVAPITAIIVLLLPSMTHASSTASAIDRVLEVALGGATGLVVSFVLLPASAYGLAIEAAARTLERMARALGELLAGATRGLDADQLHRIQDGIGHSLVRLSTVCAEAERERSARLAAAPDTGPLQRTLLRLRHDLVMIGRAAIMPLPDALSQRLDAPLAQVAAAASDYLRGSSAALLARRVPPAFDAVELALDRYVGEVAALRREGVTRGLPGETAQSFFSLGFALEQMRQNLKDLDRCVTEWTRSPRQREDRKAAAADVGEGEG